MQKEIIMDKVDYTYRFLARLVIEAVTPLAVGSGENSIQTDALIMLDVNGMPYIPGTSLAGVFRHSIADEEKAKSLFGYTASGDQDSGMGSRIIFTEARMIGKEGIVLDDLQKINFDDTFYKYFTELPIRQHVRINQKGVSEETGKFDEQVAFKGTRFCFEIEMVSDGSNWNDFELVLNQIGANGFRIGGKTRSGFGEIKVVSCQTANINLKNEDHLKGYLDKSSSLAESANWKHWKGFEIEKKASSNYIEYMLTIAPNDFLLFGSGMGDEDADMTPVKESYTLWENNMAKMVMEAFLIPGSSIKGALAHRVAYYYNKFTNAFADKDSKAKTGSQNLAVNQIFGFEGVRTKNDTIGQKVGNIYISDMIEKIDSVDKLLNHVAIDRFTGGAMAGALYTEKTTYVNTGSVKKRFYIKILLKDKLYEENVVEALETSLIDICKGMLPLGGGVNRGNGCFEGNLSKNGEIIFKNQDENSK